LISNIRNFQNSHVKLLNKHLILDLIRFTSGGLSRADLSRELGLTRAAVTVIINDLLNDGYVREAETKYSGGRRPAILEVSPDKGYVIGVDLGATHLQVCLADFSAAIIHELEIDINIEDGPESCLNKVDRLINQALLEKNLTMDKVNAIGLGVPGPVVIDEGWVIKPPIMPGWGEFPIREYLTKKWNVPVVVNNDADLGALGEWAYGAGRGEKNLAFIKVGTGIGAGLIFENNIYYGSTGSAGEIGHFTIEEKGPKCTCGNFGCLEAFVGGVAIAHKAQEAVRKGRRSLLAGQSDLCEISVKDVVKAAKRGDLLSQQILSEAGTFLGIAIASLVNLFNPGIVIIGGGLSASGDLLLDAIRDEVANRSFLAKAGLVKISTSILENRSVILGAVTQALTVALHEPFMYN